MGGQQTVAAADAEPTVRRARRGDAEAIARLAIELSKHVSHGYAKLLGQET